MTGECLACVQKHQKCNFVPRLLSVIKLDLTFYNAMRYLYIYPYHILNIERDA